MPTYLLTYPLSDDGFIDHWLMLGPCDTPPIEEGPTAAPPPPDFSAPVELDRFACGGRTLFWLVEPCQPDHLLDWGGFLPVRAHRRGLSPPLSSVAAAATAAAAAANRRLR